MLRNNIKSEFIISDYKAILLHCIICSVVHRRADLLCISFMVDVCIDGVAYHLQTVDEVGIGVVTLHVYHQLLTVRHMVVEML